MEELTFAQLDALERERQAKINDVTDRLERLFRRHFDAGELSLIWNHRAPDLSIVRDAIQRARG